jgi:uncharacterized RDD family membrane protein YckC
MNTNHFKTCPFCKEQIRVEAVKCRFCGEWLQSEAAKFTSPSPPPMIHEPPKIQPAPSLHPSPLSASPPPIQEEVFKPDDRHCWICGNEFGRRKPKLVYGYRACRGCYASFANRRCLAHLIDNIAIWVFVPVVLTLIVIQPTNVEAERVVPMGFFTLFSFSIGKAAAGDFGVGFALMTWCLLVAWFIKDGFDGRSVGKRLLGLQVISLKLKQPAGCKASFKRSLPLLLPFAPLLAGCQCGFGRRIGDGWAGTRVIWNKNRQGFMAAISNEQFSTEADDLWMEAGAKLEAKGKLPEALEYYRNIAEQHKGTSTGSEAERCSDAVKTKIEKLQN